MVPGDFFVEAMKTNYASLEAALKEKEEAAMPMSYEENRRIESIDRFWNQSVQAERDPYVSHNREYKVWAQKETT